jgi:uncharacterized membrane protein YhaH (DUF805 family)
VNNPYSAPNAVLSDAGSNNETYQPKIFAVSGRIGRLRYLAYTFFLTLLCAAAIGILSAVLIPMLASRREGTSAAAVVMLVILYLPIIAVTLIMAKRRFNDLDHSGWLGLLMLVPLINFFCGLYLIFGPGSAEANRYGAPPAKNPVLVVIAGLVLPLLFAAGVVAAIAIPAYQTYKARAAQNAAPASKWVDSPRAEADL